MATIAGQGRVRDRDAYRYTLNLSSPASTTSQQQVEVLFVAPPLISAALQQQVKMPLSDHLRGVLAIAATLQAVDQSPDLVTQSSRVHVIEVGPEEALSLLQRPKLPDRALRRYVVRRVYSHYSRNTLLSTVELDDVDQVVTGAETTDFLRNVQLLASEGYLAQDGDERSLVVRPTAKLVRDVENYGAAKDDIVSERDYAAAIAAYPNLEKYRDSLLLERRRFEVARTAQELTSVFRATAPTIEAILSALLREHGSTKYNDDLGPMINDMVRLKLGATGLWSQLNHILKFGRDLAEHGEEVSEPVLRIACENAFELAPQLGALFPKR